MPLGNEGLFLRPQETIRKQLKMSKKQTLYFMTKTLSKFVFILSFILSFGNPFIAKAEEIQKFSMYTFPKHLPKGIFFNAKGNTVSVQDYHGKVVVLNFFKVTCKKCVKELPSLNELAKTYPDIVVLTVSEGLETPSVLRSFFDEKGLDNLDVFYDTNEAYFKKTGGIHVPETYLISKGGERLGEIRGGANFMSPIILEQIQKAQKNNF